MFSSVSCIVRIDFCAAQSPFVHTFDLSTPVPFAAYQHVVESVAVVDNLVWDAAGLTQVMKAVGRSQRQRLCGGTGDKVSGGLRGNAVAAAAVLSSPLC